MQMNSSNQNVSPWVHRHTAESWRERVKKRVVPFRLRVDAYLHEGIDRTLRTQEERDSGSGPASLMGEDRRRATTSNGGSNATAKMATAKSTVSLEASRAKLTKAVGPSNGTSEKRMMDSEETRGEKDTTEGVSKRQK